MFCECQNLIDINELKNWKINNAKSICGMLSSCHNLNNMDSLYKWKLSNNVNKKDVVLYL
jgi:hypothetical protein